MFKGALLKKLYIFEKMLMCVINNKIIIVTKYLKEYLLKKTYGEIWRNKKIITYFLLFV